MRKTLLFFIIFLFSVRPGFADGESASPKGKIKGVVLDEKTKEPLEYATIALYSVPDNKQIGRAHV